MRRCRFGRNCWYDPSKEDPIFCDKNPNRARDVEQYKPRGKGPGGRAWRRLCGGGKSKVVIACVKR